MIKTRMIRESIIVAEEKDRLDTKINSFIKDSKTKIIDIKFASTGKDNRPTALIIYEEGLKDE